MVYMTRTFPFERQRLTEAVVEKLDHPDDGVLMSVLPDGVGNQTDTAAMTTWGRYHIISEGVTLQTGVKVSTSSRGDGAVIKVTGNPDLYLTGATEAVLDRVRAIEGQHITLTVEGETVPIQLVCTNPGDRMVQYGEEDGDGIPPTYVHGAFEAEAPGGMTEENIREELSAGLPGWAEIIDLETRE